MLRALLLAVWHDLSDVRLAEALEDRASFRRFCGFARTEATPERTAFVRFRRDDAEASWAGHRRRKAVHGYKVHVGADAETALVEQIAVTPGNVHDGNHGESALPPDPGEVYAVSAYRGRRFATAVRARGGTPRIAAVGIWARSDPASQREAERWLAERNRALHRVRA